MGKIKNKNVGFTTSLFQMKPTFLLYILQKAYQKPVEKFDMLLSIQDIIAKGKGPGYERWAKKYNIKNLAKALIFFQENDVRTYEELTKRVADSSQKFSEMSDRIKASEKRLDEISVLRGKW